MIKLDILSDPICPWCYIGKTLLFRALEDRPDHPFVIEWHPFQLNPDMPPEGMDRRAYLEAKFGSREKVVEAHVPVDAAAEAAGLSIDFGAIARTPNTLDAHRLIHWAGIERRQTDVVAALFDAHFADGRDISDHDVLADIADTAGMDAAVIRRLLASDSDVEEIRTRDAHARERGITGVPTFIVAETHVVPGAQQTELWLKLIDEINGQLAGG
ncbi:DsbA family oxidoreductase [Tropicimonas isoalkanivorans]|uniref:Predicted dithiol-disulfide isomerase, DsbA family n=1 Tax=Tropicimonas isoalkanivorans TaxID=441112 RepID=A0A1I1ED20_9RHOB|nr:DsbA family oxidoreductase [Tropicimonas isoalkanivorans]SFB82813.1 Predicted dithiol-disulfide isomerase, DsbA family [Tropicimonas isoalkanivorans]